MNMKKKAKPKPKPKPKAKKREINKETDCEDWCFSCKDGGDLILCDYEDCIKVYHSECMENDPNATKSGGQWICGRHSCFLCHNSPLYFCYCCPKALCRQCIGVVNSESESDESVKFIPVKGKKGFCEECLDLILVEERVDLETGEGNLDLKDRNTVEGLFLEYWEIIKDEEGLTLEDVYEADYKLQKGKTSKNMTNAKSKKRSKRKEDIEVILSDSDSESDDDASEDDTNLKKGRYSNYRHKSKVNHKRKKDIVISSSDIDQESDDSEDSETMSKAKGSKAIEYIGWGSKPLIEFLRSLGRDTTEEISQGDVNSIICQYIQEKKLFDPRQRKKILCDGMLKSLFKRKHILRNNISKLLEPHFLANLEQSEEDVVESGSHVKRDKTAAARKRQKTGSSNRKAEIEEVDFNCQESSFASIVTENIKLVYIRKSLVEELLNEPGSFESKVLGSFVKVKNDSKDRTQRNTYQILQVTGIKENPKSNESKGEILLQLSTKETDVSISQLSDFDITEEEVDDLREKVEKGLIPKPTVVDLQRKAEYLHKEVKKHWIEKELVRLQKYIDFTNEKGWRRELDEYLDQREILKRPAEQERLLQQTPKVIPELITFKIDPEDMLDVGEEDKDESP